MYYHSTALKKSTWVKPDRFVPHSEDAEDHSTEETAVTAVAEQRTLSESVVTVGEEWRVVLSWSQHPKNLDLYCITNFKPRLIYSGESNVGGRNNANKGNIELDISVQNGFGPETITFTPNPAKKYRFIVYNVTGNTFSSLADSGAMMNLMKGSGGPVKFHIPTDVVLDDCGECARFWHVFDLFRGVITPVNRIISKDLRDVPVRFLAEIFRLTDSFQFVSTTFFKF